MTTTTTPTATRPSTEPEWGTSLDLLPHEQANLDAFTGVFPHWNSGNIPAMLEHYEDDIVWRNIPMGEVYDGKEAVRRFLEDLFRALPDLELDVTLRVPRGKYVAEEYTIRGTHLGPMFGLPPSGRRLEIRAMSMVELRGGRLKEDHFYFDAAGAMQQMGYLPDTAAVRRPAGRAVFGLLGWWRRRGGSAAR
ncbi:MAG: ester cyclase [Micrococcales bacterium]|nr:ester cyclase [Micrococcales bacterium]